MTSLMAYLFFIMLLFPTSALSADIQTELNNAGRIVDWQTNSGVPGGPTARATICQTLTPGATAAQINSAIQLCPNEQVVKLNAGTYNLTTTINFTGKSRVTVRGDGASTRLVFSGGISCGPGGGTAVATGNCNIRYFAYDGTFHTPWTAGYSRGTTQITVEDATNITVGNTVILDQQQDTSDNGGAVISGCPGGPVGQSPSFFVSNEAVVNGGRNSG